MKDNKIYEMEKESLFDKRFQCPVCGNELKAKAVKTGKAKLLDTDTDLCPIYQDWTPIKYDVIICPHCGYTALSRYFNEVSLAQVKFIKEKVLDQYNGKYKEFEVLDYEETIRRYKLALLISMAKNAELSELGFICLKLAWVLRSKRQELEKEGHADEAEQVLVEENQFLKKAYVSFKDAFMKEEFPICGMDETTFSYLLANLAYRAEDYSNASRWVQKVMADRDAIDRLKNKARELKKAVIKKMEEAQA